MEISDVLGAVEHDVRGVAATIGGMARMLADGKLSHDDQRSAFERLQRASARLDALASDAQTLASWMVPGSADQRAWRLAALGPIVEGVIGDGEEITVSADQLDRWRRGLVRISDDNAFEDAVRSLYTLACREQGAAVACRVRLVASSCDVFFDSDSAEGWDDPTARAPLDVHSGGLKPFVALAVFAAHGVTTWRGPGSHGVGLTVPLTFRDGQT
jgi:hypothetical protein